MREDTIVKFGSYGQLWTVPEVDRARQATESLRGYVYQLHQSASAWIKLQEGELLILEAAEDYAIILKDPAGLEEILSATQVKNRENRSVTLNSPDVIEAIKSLFRLQEDNPGRFIKFVFLTTSPIGTEHRNPLPSKKPGLETWNEAAQGGDVSEIRSALFDRLEEGDLKTFINESNDQDLRQRILIPMVFACGSPDWHQIAEANRDALVRMREEFGSTVPLAYQSYDAVIGKIIDKVLSPDRTLTHGDLVDLLVRATSLPIPSALATELLKNSSQTTSKHPIDIAVLRQLSKATIMIGKPPSVAALVGDVDPKTNSAFLMAQNIIRTLVARDRKEQEPTTSTIRDLVTSPHKKHLILGPPGSGKTHALWRTAHDLLADDTLVPIYLQAAQIKTWDDLKGTILEIEPTLSSLDSLLKDERVCFFIDGWSEFALGEHLLEKGKALRVLSEARVIANGKFDDSGESTFQVWSLELFSQSQVKAVLAMSFSGAPIQEEKVLDLLRLPFLLSIHLLGGANANKPGELLRQFHNRFVRDLPSTITEALAHAVLEVRETRKAGTFHFHFDKRARELGIHDPTTALARLGTITEQGSKMIPIHDLYWDWLAGIAILGEHRIPEAIGPLGTRGEIELAIQSGYQASVVDVREAQNVDLVLAAHLAVNSEISVLDEGLKTRIEAALLNDHLPIKCRGALASLATRNPDYLVRALDVRTEIERNSFYLPEWEEAFRPSELYAHRATLADWIGNPGSNDLLQAIAKRGGPEWGDWLREIANLGKISQIEALAIALACDPKLPNWGLAHVDDLIRTKPWMLRTVATRGSNLELARYIASNYDHLVQINSMGNSGWIDLNRVLVSCSDDNIFQILFESFSTLRPRAQEYLEYAIVERGDPWLSAFQRIVFTLPEAQKKYHQLANTISLEIDDTTARKWIDSGHAEIGWRVLIERHGQAILPELVQQLPASFDGHLDISALAYMRHFKSIPSSINDDLWARLGGTMQPKVTQDLIFAASRAGEPGIVSIVNFVLKTGAELPAYFRRQALNLYRDWQTTSGRNVWIKFPGIGAIPFDQLIAIPSTLAPWDDRLSPQMLALVPEIAIGFVIGFFEQDKTKAEAVLNVLTLKDYNAEILDRMLTEPSLAALVPKVFSNAFDAFPAEAIQHCLDNPHIDQEMLLFRLSFTSNPMHRPVHASLISRVLKTSPKFHHFRYVANMLRSHTTYEIKRLLSECDSRGYDNWIWLLREIEIARSERLVDEEGIWLS